MNTGFGELVSVIVPFLNASNWLIEALESVLNQTYTNWELIVIDDGSEEKHSAVARKFCKRYENKVLYTEHKGHVNKGVTISRNEAAKLCRGKYLAFLDADDIWLPNKLTNQLSMFAKHPEAQLVCEPSVQWYSWEDETAEDFDYIIGVPPEQLYFPQTLNKLLYPLKKGNSPAPSGIMIHKEAFERVNGFEPIFSGIYELYEDQAFLSKVYLNETVFVSGSFNHLYRKHAGSMSSAADNIERYHTVRRFYFNWLEDYMCQQKIEDAELRMLICEARKSSFVR